MRAARSSSLAAPFLTRIYVVPERVPTHEGFPYSLPFVRGLDLPFKRAVTYLVGENGSGKSTLIEAIAEACGLPVSGGGRSEIGDRHGPEQHSALRGALRPSFSRRPKDGYFFRAEYQAHFASLLDQRRDDPDFIGDPYSRYGGRSLHAQSHGEAFLAILLNRLRSGVILMDEPESALSPQRQLVLLARMAELVGCGGTQFIVATHSPSCSPSPRRTSSASMTSPCGPSGSKTRPSTRSREASWKRPSDTGASSGRTRRMLTGPNPA